MKIINYNINKNIIVNVINNYLNIKKKMMKFKYQNCIINED